MAPDRPPSIHCEHLADTLTASTLCGEPRTAETSVMSTRQFAFGIGHPDLTDRLCDDCKRDLRRFIGY